MKSVEVVAALICKEGKFFAARRGYGEQAGGWEFPGGKIERGESLGEAIIREIREELRIEVAPEHFITTVIYDYPDFRLTMHCLLCRLVGGEIVLTEHKEARWLTMEELSSVDWLPPDVVAVEKLKELFRRKDVPENAPT